MTQDEIIGMARYADREWDCDRDMFEWLETFAQAVAAKERERLFDMLHEMHVKTNGQHNYYLHAVVHIRAKLKARGEA